MREHDNSFIDHKLITLCLRTVHRWLPAPYGISLHIVLYGREKTKLQKAYLFLGSSSLAAITIVGNRKRMEEKKSGAY